MDQDKIPSPHTLPNKPLVEAIFEIKWGLQQDDSDPGFQIFLGRLYDKVKEHFPALESLPTSLVPDNMAPHVVRHRFRKTKEGWPLLQVGPGILTANDTGGYTWDTFRPILQNSVDALFAAYPVELAPLKVQEVTLRYINGIALGEEAARVLDFLRENLHLELSLDSQLFEDPKISGAPVGLQIRLNYPLEKPRGMGVLSFATGLRENIPSVIWENHVKSRKDDAPTSVEAFGPWFEDAHSVIERWFFTLSRGKLLERFGGRNES